MDSCLPLPLLLQDSSPAVRSSIIPQQRSGWGAQLVDDLQMCIAGAHAKRQREALPAASPTMHSSGNLFTDELSGVLAAPVRFCSSLAFSVCFRNSLNGWEYLQYNVSDSWNVSLLFLNRERPAYNFCPGERKSGVLPSIVPLWIQKSRWNHHPARRCSHGKKDGSQVARDVKDCTSSHNQEISNKCEIRGTGSRSWEQKLSLPAFWSEWKSCLTAL